MQNQKIIKAVKKKAQMVSEASKTSCISCVYLGIGWDFKSRWTGVKQTLNMCNMDLAQAIFTGG